MSLAALRKAAKALLDVADTDVDVARLLQLPLREAAWRIRPRHGLGARFLWEVGEDPSASAHMLLVQIAKGHISKGRVGIAQLGLQALATNAFEALQEVMPDVPKVDVLDDIGGSLLASEARTWVMEQGLSHLANQRPGKLTAWSGPRHLLSKAQQTGLTVLQLLEATADQREEWLLAPGFDVADFNLLAIRALTQARQEERAKDALIDEALQPHALEAKHDFFDDIVQTLSEVQAQLPPSVRRRLYPRSRRRSTTELHTQPLRLTYREKDVHARTSAVDEVVVLLEPYLKGGGRDAGRTLLMKQKGPDAEDLRGTAAFAFFEWLAHPPHDEGRLLLQQAQQLLPTAADDDPTGLLSALDDALVEQAAPHTQSGVVTWRLYPNTSKTKAHLPDVRDRVRVRVQTQRQRQDGSWSTSQPIHLDELRYGRVAGAVAQDKVAAEQLQLARSATRDKHDGRRTTQPLFVGALSALAGHPRVFFKDHDVPIPVDVVPVLVDWMEATEDGARGVVLFVSLGGEEVDRDDALQQLRAWGGLVSVTSTGARVGRIPPTLVPVLERLARLPSAFVPHPQADAVVERLEQWRQQQGQRKTSSAPAVEVDRQDIFGLRLFPTPAGGLQVQVMVRPCPGGAWLPPGEGSGVALGFDDGRRVCVRRQLEREIDGADVLLSRDASRPWFADANSEVRESEWSFRFSPRVALDVVTAIEELKDSYGDRLVLLWPRGSLKQQVHALDVSALKVRIEGKRNWLEVKGGAQLSGDDGAYVPLPTLLAHLHDKKRFIEVGKGVYIRMTQAMRQRLGELEAAVSEEVRQDGEVHFKAAGPGAWMLVDLEDDEWQLSVDDDALRERARMQEAMSLSPALPAGFQGELQPHQVEGVHWLQRLMAWGTGGVLADDMGLGKTIQAICLLLDRAEAGVQLVVAPASVVAVWQKELATFAPSLDVTVFHGSQRKALFEDVEGAQRAHHVVVTSYEMLTRDVDALNQLQAATAVFDEAQALKNSNTRRTRAARDLVADRKIALSGTPVENHLGELWSILHVVSPSVLGSWRRFHACFALPIEKFADPGKQALLARKVSPFILRRTKAQVAQHLPPRLEREVLVDLSPPEQQLYNAVLLQLVDKLRQAKERKSGERLSDGHGGVQVLAGLTRLRILACDAALDDAAEAAGLSMEVGATPSAKQKAMLRLLDKRLHQAAGGAVLVFSQFTRVLKRAHLLAQRAGHRCFYLDGATSLDERQDLVRRFQDGEADVFFISLKAGGTGLTLTAADTVVHLDPWWNPAAMAQAADRAHRLGQTKDVTIYRLIARGTVEEKMLQLHHDKQQLSDGVLEGADGAVRADLHDLERLLTETAVPPVPIDEVT